MEWFYMSGDKQIGPISEKAIGDLIVSREVSPHTPVWNEGLSQWMEAEQTALSTLFKKESQGVTPPPFCGVQNANQNKPQIKQAAPNPRTTNAIGWGIFLVIGIILLCCGLIPVGGPVVALSIYHLGKGR